MAAKLGPSIINNGLVLDLDAADINSYIGSGTSWKDMTGNGNSGTLVNGPSFSSANGGSIVFDGIDDYINCGNGNAINFGSGDFSVEMWFTRYTNATTNLRLLSKGAESDASGSAGFAFFGSDGGINFAINPSGTRHIISAASYSVGEWVHVVGVVQRGSTMRTYKNAVLTNSATAPAGSVSNASINLNIGRSPESNICYWAGKIAIVRIYNKNLTATEILQNFNSLKARFGV
jgi:hypothetical protein